MELREKKIIKLQKLASELNITILAAFSNEFFGKFETISATKKVLGIDMYNFTDYKFVLEKNKSKK